MPLEYFFNGHPRWTLFWENPNHWAAFLSCLLPWVWLGQCLCLKRNDQLPFKIVVFALYASELAFWFLLIKTYSRGGLIAAVFGMAFFFILHGKKVAQTLLSVPFLKAVKIGTDRSVCATFTGWKPVLRKIIIRVALIAVLCAAVGFVSRISPSYVAQDKSVLNRMDLWKGALAMMHDSPFHGWGTGQGGRAFANWYQPLDKTVRPMSFVNSYLDIGVEQGAHILCLVLIIGLLFIIFGFLLRKHSWPVASAACLVAWMVGNVWSNMWNQWGLWILPALSMLALLVAIIKFGKHRLRVALFSVVGGLAIMFVLLQAGSFMSKALYWKAIPLKETEVALLSKRVASNTEAKACEIWVDNAIFGPVFGKLLRSDFVDLPFSELTVYSPWARGRINTTPAPATSIYTGFQAERAFPLMEHCKTIVLYPTVLPPETTATANANLLVCLPAVNASSYDMPWCRWAAKTDARLIYSTQSGRRIFPQNNSLFWRPMVSDE